MELNWLNLPTTQNTNELLTLTIFSSKRDSAAIRALLSRDDPYPRNVGQQLMKAGKRRTEHMFRELSREEPLLEIGRESVRERGK